MSTYFTLYFIPLFETQHHGDYVECLGCHGESSVRRCSGCGSPLAAETGIRGDPGAPP